MATSKPSNELVFPRLSAMTGDEECLVQVSDSTVEDDEKSTQVKCKACDEKDSEKYCWDCRMNFCGDCFPLFVTHRGNNPSHSIVSSQEYKLFKEIVNPQWTDEQRQQQHEQDILNLWFSVDRRSNGELCLEEFPRFGRLVEDHQQKHGRKSPCYAQLVSFIGNAGAGKSTLIRVLMQQPWNVGRLGATERPSVCLPISGRQESTVPTSGDVHLYAAPYTDAAQEWLLLLYADCEGFRGGSQPPAALEAKQHVFANLREAIRVKTANSVGWMREAISFLKMQSMWTLNLNGNREDAVKELFPRLLYNFSDVVVHVVHCAASRMFEKDIVKLLEWAQNSQKTAVNRVILPHLIVVLNSSPIELSDWDPDNITSEILREHLPALKSNTVIKKYQRMLNQLGNATITTLDDLLKRCYSSVKFIRIPNAENQHLYSKQLQSLDSLIREAAGTAECTKTEAGCLLTSEIERQMFTIAFDHYKDNLEKPFDFLESLLSVRPLEDSLSATFFAFLRMAAVAYRPAATKASALEFCSAVTPVLCSTIALDYRRSNKKLPGKLRNIYRGKTMNSQCIGEGEYVTMTYQSQVAKAIDDFFDKACQCDFVCQDGRQCVNFRLAHDKVFEHQDSTGEIIGFGTFRSVFVDELWRCWNDEIDKSLRELDDHQGKSDAVVHPGEQSNAELMMTWTAHCGNLEKVYSAISDLDVRKIEACSWCLRDKQPQSLRCGHRICWRCAELVGDSLTDSNVEIGFAIRSCDLHQNRLNFEGPDYIPKARDTGPVVVRQGNLER